MNKIYSPTTEGRAAAYLDRADVDIKYAQEVKRMVSRVLEVYEKRQYEPDGPRSIEFDEAICCDYGLLLLSCGKFLRKWDR